MQNKIYLLSSVAGISSHASSYEVEKCIFTANHVCIHEKNLKFDHVPHE